MLVSKDGAPNKGPKQEGDGVFDIVHWERKTKRLMFSSSHSTNMFVIAGLDLKIYDLVTIYEGIIKERSSSTTIALWYLLFTSFLFFFLDH